MTQKKLKPSVLLQTWIEQGFVNSRYEEFVRRIKDGSSTDFFIREVEKLGFDKADQRLTQEHQLERRQDFASAVPTIAAALHKLAITDKHGKVCHVVDPGTIGLLPGFAFSSADEYAVAFFNHGLPNRLSDQSVGKIWGQTGSLGLKAITLQAGRNLAGTPCAKLGLILPLSSEDKVKKEFEGGFKVMVIDVIGTTSIYKYGVGKISDHAYLDYKLGLAEPDSLIRGMSSIEEASDKTIGFPNAFNLVADSLPSLTDYLDQLAIYIGKLLK